MKLESWQFAGRLYFSRNRSVFPMRLQHTFTRSLIRVETTSSVKEQWRRAAYMQQIANAAEISNHVVPLKQATIFKLSSLPDTYELTFKCVSWLPELSVQVWEYGEAIPDQIDELKSLIQLLL